MTIIARTIRVRGKVQGVGFRENMRKMAEHMGITGWVRNRVDGSVEAHVQGEPVAVEDILQWARIGPPHGKVDHLVSENAEPDPRFRTFERRDTA